MPYFYLILLRREEVEIMKGKNSKFEKFSKWIVIITAMAMGIFTGILIPELGGETRGLIKGFIYVMLSYALAIYLQIIVHEFGHYAMGKLTGYDFVSFRIASWVLARIDGELKIKRYKLAGADGQCLMSPPEADEEGKYPVMLYNLGGGLFNIIIGLISWNLLYKNIDLPDLLRILGGVSSIVGGYLAFINLVPLKPGGMPNDGLNLYNLINDEDSRRAFWLQLKINEYLTDGNRLRDINPSWLKRAEGVDLDNPLINAIESFRVNYYMDRREFEKARELMGEIMVKNYKLVSIHKYELILDLAYLEMLDGNYDNVRSLLDKEIRKYIKATKDSLPSKRRFLHAYELFINRDEEAARVEKEKFEEISEDFLFSSEAQGDRELIELSKREYQKKNI